MLKIDTPPEWKALARVYEARGVSFPMEDVETAVWGDFYDIEFDGGAIMKARSRSTLSKGDASVHQFAEALKTIKALPSDSISDQDRVKLDLYVKLIGAVYRRAAAQRAGWEVPPAGEPKAQQVKGAENRAETYSRFLMRNLYRALRPAYDVAWPDCAGDRNTKPIRKHIAIIMAPLELGVDLSPAGHGPMKYAIDYELKLRKARKAQKP